MFTQFNEQALRTPRPEPRYIEGWPPPRPHAPPKRHARIRLRTRSR